jgi:hypothetical protein
MWHDESAAPSVAVPLAGASGGHSSGWDTVSASRGRPVPGSGGSHAGLAGGSAPELTSMASALSATGTHGSHDPPPCRNRLPAAIDVVRPLQANGLCLSARRAGLASMSVSPPSSSSSLLRGRLEHASPPIPSGNNSWSSHQPTSLAANGPRPSQLHPVHLLVVMGARLLPPLCGREHPRLGICNGWWFDIARD